MQLDHVRAEIERMRLQVHRQRGDIRKLQQAGISTASAEALLARMLNQIDKLCAIPNLSKVRLAGCARNRDAIKGVAIL